MDKFSKAVGIDQEIIEVDGKTGNEIVKAKPVETSDVKEDYDRSREIYKVVSEIGMTSLGKLQETADITGQPRAYEVLATMMRSLNETAKQMNDLHKEKDESIKRSSNASVNVEKAVFVGSPSDLLKNIENDK